MEGIKLKDRDEASAIIKDDIHPWPFHGHTHPWVFVLCFGDMLIRWVRVNFFLPLWRQWRLYLRRATNKHLMDARHKIFGKCTKVMIVTTSHWVHLRNKTKKNRLTSFSHYEDMWRYQLITMTLKMDHVYWRQWKMRDYIKIVTIEASDDGKSTPVIGERSYKWSKEKLLRVKLGKSSVTLMVV